MSVLVRYLTNGEKTLYTIRDSGVEPPFFGIFHTEEEIDESGYGGCIILNKPPQFCQPDLARVFGVQHIFYPEWDFDCVRTDLKEHNVQKCIAEQCKYSEFSEEAERGTCPRLQKN